MELECIERKKLSKANTNWCCYWKWVRHKTLHRTFQIKFIFIIHSETATLISAKNCIASKQNKNIHRPVRTIHLFEAFYVHHSNAIKANIYSKMIKMKIWMIWLNLMESKVYYQFRWANRMIIWNRHYRQNRSNHKRVAEAMMASSYDRMQYQHKVHHHQHQPHQQWPHYYRIV